MKININNQEVTLKWGFRAQLFYEELAGSTWGVGKVGLREILMMFYALVHTSKDFEGSMDVDAFIEWCDDNQDTFTKFCAWLTAVAAGGNNLADTPTERSEIRQNGENGEKKN